MMVICIYELRMRTWVYVVPLLCYLYVRVTSGDLRMGFLVGSCAERWYVCRGERK